MLKGKTGSGREQRWKRRDSDGDGGEPAGSGPGVELRSVRYLSGKYWIE